MTYHQDTEFRLALDLLARLDHRIVIDVGAEKGSFADACLQAGAERVVAIEPYPAHVAALRERFAGTPAVTVLDVALGDRDGEAVLHIAHDASGQPLDYHHSLVAFADTDDVRWSNRVNVRRRTLESLVGDGSVPHRVGLLKIDTEGGDLSVLLGLGALDCDVVIVEYGHLPGRPGNSPYRIGDVAAVLRPRGLSDFVFIKRHDEFEAMQYGAEVREGDWGNLVFVHERMRDRLLPVIHERAAAVNDALIDRALWFRRECEKRLDVISDLAQHRPKPSESSPAPWIAAADPGERERLASGHPKVSIVTPSFNQGRFLEQTITSVLDQKYPNLEYIIIDGGSRDDSVDVIRRYEDRVAFWISEPDSGQTDALNKGFARATGDIVAWVNSDDFYYPGAIDAAVAAFQAEPELGLVYGRGDRVDETGRIIREFECTRPFDLEALLYGIDYILQPTTFMRRQALHEVGPFDTRRHYAFDWELWMRLGKRFPARMIDMLVAAGREYASAKTFSGGFPRVEEIRELVAAQTGQEISIGYLSYYLNTLLESLARTDMAGVTPITTLFRNVQYELQDLLCADRLRITSTGNAMVRREIPAHNDSWVGRELRLHRRITSGDRFLCLKGSFPEPVAKVVGPLVLHAAVDRLPIGPGIALTDGPFAIYWKLPAQLPEASSIAGAADVVNMSEVSITSEGVQAARLGHPDDPRILSFIFTELEFVATPPADANPAGDPSVSAAAVVFEAARQRIAPTAPYVDGWAGPVLRVEVPHPPDARVLCLSGVHAGIVAEITGPLRLRISIGSRVLGAGVVDSPGPFALYWPIPRDVRTSAEDDGEAPTSTVLVTSTTSVVPGLFWKSEDFRTLSFGFKSLSFQNEPPAESLPGEEVATPSVA